MKIDVLGVAFDNVTRTEAVEAAMTMLQTEATHYIVTPNPEIIRAARESAALMTAMEEASLVLADGVGVIKAAQILETPLKERVPGIDFAADFMAAMAAQGKRLYLLGAKPGIAAQAGEKLAEKYPGLVICGTHDGYFQEDQAVANEIGEARPDVVFVCLGSPRQELWMQAWGSTTRASVLVGLGGSLDIFSGTSARAPKWMQAAGLEWLYRLVREPWRLGRMMKIPAVLLWAHREKRRR